MSKRRRASELMFKTSHGLKYPCKVVAYASGTGTAEVAGVISVIAASVATRAYLTVAATTNIGTLVGTA